MFPFCDAGVEGFMHASQAVNYVCLILKTKNSKEFT